MNNPVEAKNVEVAGTEVEDVEGKAEVEVEEYTTVDSKAATMVAVPRSVVVAVDGAVLTG